MLITCEIKSLLFMRLIIELIQVNVRTRASNDMYPLLLIVESELLFIIGHLILLQYLTFSSRNMNLIQYSDEASML